MRLKAFVIAFVILSALGIRQSSNGLAAPAAWIPAPRSVNTTVGDHIDKVSISWNAVRGASAYRIFRGNTPDFPSASEIGTTAAGFFFDTGAVVGQDHYYWVRAETAGAVSDPSGPERGVRASGTFHSTIFSPLTPPPVPFANPVTAAKAMLGKTLFWDEQLSSTRTVACGTCHRPAAGGSDPRTASAGERSRNPGPDNVFGSADDVFGSPGVIRNDAGGTLSPSPLFGLREQVTGRKAPSYLNVGITTNGTFWDGRATNTFRDPLTNAVLINDWGGLENQSLGPPLSGVEMAHGGRTLGEMAARISAARPLALATAIPGSLRDWIDGRSYPQLFEEAFGTPDVTPSRIALAIATHERTLFSDRAPIDRWASQTGDLLPEEDRGRSVFVNVNCSFCHGGPFLADQNFHNVGVRPQTDDLGRGAITGNANDNGRFKTPTLRNVELRAPFFHNGRIATLEEVVEFYNRGGDFNAPNINRGLVRALNLTAQQKTDLVAFLRRPMTDTRVRDELPPFDRPRLYTESERVPATTGAGRPGTGGAVPEIIAPGPPVLGNTAFPVGLSNALGNASAVLVIDDADPGTGAVIPPAGSFARVVVTTNPDGYASAVLALPADPANAGRTLFGRWYVTDPAAANGFSVSPASRFTVFGPTVAVARRPVADFDGDGRTDLSIFRPSNGQWWIARSGDGGGYAAEFGTSSDLPVAADFTGDGRTDIALWRPADGEWYVLRSEDSSYYSFPFGSSGDIPSAGDFDADGRADAAVFRPASGTWFILNSGGGATIRRFGVAGDVPAAADYDGDGRTDLAVYRPAAGQWWIERSSGGAVAFGFGTVSDEPVAADFTGDGRADAAFRRPSTGEWFVLRSEDGGFYSVPFGLPGDIAVPGDFDGDGRTDPAVFRPGTGTWYASRSSGGTLIRQFGLATDVPIP
jgi:cytochrome c peroxidase